MSLTFVVRVMSVSRTQTCKDFVPMATPRYAKAPKIKVKRKNSRQKGSTYERQIAKLFTKWSGVEWRRTPMSGGWSKTIDFGVAGDLVCAHDTDIHVELKNREGWCLTDLIFGLRVNAGIVSWLKQAERDAKANGKPVALLIFRRNRLRDSLVMHKKTDPVVYRKKCKTLTYGKYVILSLTSFLKYAVPPETKRRAHKT